MVPLIVAFPGSLFYESDSAQSTILREDYVSILELYFRRFLVSEI